MLSKWFPWLCALFVLALAAAPRWVLHDRTPHREASWTVSDPDSLYHARRVERALLEGGLPAATDRFLNHPDGAAIPWPPYYDLLAAWTLGPFVRDGDNIDRGAVERGVAWLPFLFGILTSLAAFGAGRTLAGNLAGLMAGGLHALALGSVVYSQVGNGDHHAFCAMLAAWVLWGLAWLLKGKRLDSNRLGLVLGLALGTLMGLALGSWVAALLLMLVIDLVCAVLLFVHGRKQRQGLPVFGASLHLSALIVLLPAILQSPWKEDHPWMVVNLSWFHAVYLGLGALVFLPLLFLDSKPRLLRNYPWIIAGALLFLGLVSLSLEQGPAAGVREGFEWVSRQNTFMAGIDESRPLFGEGAVPGGVQTYLGVFAWLLPFAWLAGLWRLRKGKQLELLPWVVALPPMAVQALGQVRFTDTLLVPAVQLAAWFFIAVLPWGKLPHKLTRVRPLGFALVLLFIGISQSTTLGRMWDISHGAQSDLRPKRARRELFDWIATERSRGESAVLAPWALGHGIEWAARRPSIATNFGSYVGIDGFLAPARFFLAADSSQAEALLNERDADLVVLGAGLSDGLPGWMQAGPSNWQGRYFKLDAKGRGQLLPAWFDSVGGRLLNGGFARTRAGQPRGNSIDFLRLVHASPIVLRNSAISSWKGPTPFGWVWERVPGARVLFAGTPQTPVAVKIELVYVDRKGRTLQTVPFELHSKLNREGRAVLRVPYNTLQNNGDGRVLRAIWQQGNAQGPLRISEEAVLKGLDVQIKP